MAFELTRFMQEISQQVTQIHELKNPELLETLPLMTLLDAARLAMTGRARKNFVCSIINVKSGACSENCTFCAQSVHYTTSAQTYPFLRPSEILAKVAAKLEQGPLDYLGLVSSGRALSSNDFELLCQSAQLIRSRFNVRLCASVGFLSRERAQALQQAGFSSFHHNLETARSHFGHVCTTHQYEDRLASIKAAQSAGLRVCCGGLFGLGENFAQRCELALQLQELGVNSIPLNFLIPIKGTPLEKLPVMAPAEALRTIAVFRIFNPDKDLVVCGGRLEALQSFKNMIFSAGANGLMLGDYLTRKGGALAEDIWEMQVLGAK